MRFAYLLVILLGLTFTSAGSLQSQGDRDTIIVDTNNISPEMQKMFEDALKVNQQQGESEIEDAEQEKLESSIEIDGLIIDNTRTKSGRDFYEFFFSKWDRPEGASDFTIFIEEKPGMRRMTIIEVKVNENVVFRNNLQPRLEVVESFAEYAVNRVYGYLENYEEVQKRLDNEDLKGSGIY